MDQEKASTKWYAAGLHFECIECGGCCSGPGEGYIWVTKPEIDLIADHLKMTTSQLRRKYLRREGLRTTIIEHETTKDCIFLRKIGGKKQCVIYHVRPNQCRTWPFWADNLSSPTAWNRVAQTCPGINRGRHYAAKKIEQIKRSKKWWENPTNAADSSQK